MEQHLVDAAPERAARRVVPGPQAELGLSGTEWCCFQVGVEAREQRHPVGRLPAERDQHRVAVLARGARPDPDLLGKDRRPARRADSGPDGLALDPGTLERGPQEGLGALAGLQVRTDPVEGAVDHLEVLHEHGQPSGRTMVTGHGAWWATWALTEPSSSPANPPLPLEPTTTSWASRAASRITAAAGPSVTSETISTCGSGPRTVASCSSRPAVASSPQLSTVPGGRATVSP